MVFVREREVMMSELSAMGATEIAEVIDTAHPEVVEDVTDEVCAALVSGGLARTEEGRVLMNHLNEGGVS
jgi:glycerol-3-phosphate responsive antiterminator